MYVPDRILTNFDLEKMVDTNDQWIQERTGIRERHLVRENEATSDMATAAAKECLAKRGIEASELDVIILATITPDMMFPATAALIQNNLGASNAWGFDLSAACSGFMFALEAGAKLIETGRYNKVMVIGADTMSSIIDYTDRNTCVLFGDGAGAVLLEPQNNGFGIVDSELRIDGSGGQFLHLKAGGSRLPTSHKTVDNRLHYVYQEGRQVYKFAVKGMAEVSARVAKKNGIEGKDLKLYIPHQANLRIIDAAAKRLKLEKDQVLINIDRYANTTAATIPIGLYEAQRDGKLSKGDNVMLAAFGAGFTWGAMLIKWGLDPDE